MSPGATVMAVGLISRSRRVRTRDANGFSYTVCVAPGSAEKLGWARFAWRETDAESADRAPLIRDLLDVQ